MNNRFAIWSSIATEGVVIQDDDMLVEGPDLERLIEVWRRNPEDLVGAYIEREHFRVDETGALVELSPTCDLNKDDETVPNCTFWGDEFTMLLPHPWVVKTDYLRIYMEGHPITKLVDDMINCDDIYFNAVVANAMGRPPIAVDVPVHRFPTWMDDSSLWGTDPSWGQHRTECMAAVDAFYADEQASEDTGTVWRLALSKNAAGVPRGLATMTIFAWALSCVVFLLW